MNGKGSSPRPFSVSHEVFSDNWRRIFNSGWEHWCDETRTIEKVNHGYQCPKCGVQEECIKRTM